MDSIVRQLGRSPDVVIPILQAIQKHYRYLPGEALQRVCEITEITPARITGVATFYTQFRHRPAGLHTIRVCMGTACHVQGASAVYDGLCRHLDIPDDSERLQTPDTALGDIDTDADGIFTIEKVACLGCCSLAPVMQIDDVTFGHLTGDTTGEAVRDFLRLQERRKADRKAPRPIPAGAEAGQIRISLDTCCIARGCGDVYTALQDALVETGAKAEIKRVGCTGMSYMNPLITVAMPGRPDALYARVKPEDAKAIVLRHFRPGRITRKIKSAASRILENILTDEAWPPVTRYLTDVQDPIISLFADPQKRIATEHSGQADPTDLDEYLAGGGFEALKKCLGELTSEQVIDEIRRSGLRGRGGAGYLTGLKWLHVRQAGGEKKYVVCNGDEGDPGAFMDRMLLESQPYRVIEGVAIAAYAAGADEGYLYIRDEYPMAVGRISEAIRQCRQRGFLGDDSCRTGKSLHLHVVRGAGAFVCGEETALLASIEGRRGMPRPRPPYPARSGLWGRPTLVNNAETFSLVPWIMRNGADAFASLGTGGSKGAKVFALAGKIVRGGLVELPMGITIRRIVEEIGGGIIDGKRFKAVQIGGPSGGCIPAELADTPIDYESLTDVGAFMGSGGMVVLDESDCMVDIARYFLEFTQDQSCGRCSFCRIGTRRMLDILNRICAGDGQAGDLEKLEHLAAAVTKSSLCGLGKSAPNPVISTLRYFRDEYEAHLAGSCPAGVCRDLIKYVITDDCIGCTLCAQHCPADAITMKPHEKHEIDAEKCIRCGTCMRVCRSDAIKVE